MKSDDEIARFLTRLLHRIHHDDVGARYRFIVEFPLCA